MLPSGTQQKTEIRKTQEIKERSLTKYNVFWFLSLPQTKGALEISKTVQVKHWIKTRKCANHHPEKAEALTKYIYTHTYTLVLAQEMSSDFLTVTEYCNKRVAIRHYLRSEESHDLYPRILEEPAKKSDKWCWFLKGIRTLGKLQRYMGWSIWSCKFDNNFRLSTIPATLIMNKEAVRWLIETGLLDSILLKRLQVHLEKRGKKSIDAKALWLL